MPTDQLHFKGDLLTRKHLDFNQMLGPDFGRRYLTIKHAHYSADTDITTVTLRGILPAEFRERVKPLVEMEQARERIRKLFNG